jgi:proton glutamate symport protein
VKKPSLTTWILAGLVAGIVFGVLFPAPASRLGLLGSIFLRLIKSIVAPLVFATLVAGIASTGSVKTMGRIGGKALIYFEVLTTVALFVGLAAVNLAFPPVSSTRWRAGTSCRS